MIIENGKIRTGTAAPFGWVDNTFKNRFVFKTISGGFYYDKPWLKIIWYLIIRPFFKLKWRLKYKYMKVRCFLGYHQKGDWCFWCNKPKGEK